MKFKCDVCNKEFPSKRAVANHRRWHNLPEYKEFQEKRKNIKISKKHKKVISKANKGKNHGRWKGDDVSYKALHIWLNRNKKKRKTCEFCGKVKVLELSNIDHKYSRELTDYRWLCKSCHAKYDYEKGFRNEIIQNRKK